MSLTPPALLRTLAHAEGHTDGACLRRYAETGDEAAFAELVRRNGPLVLRACRNVLRDAAAADDAFQVTFLLLARHAARLTGNPSVAGWLHTVAVRSAGKIRRAEVRRRKRERTAPEPVAQSPDALTWAEVRERIDAELARLPDEYRLPLLLCYVQGLSYADAAQRLGCTLGALRGRLERGRDRLRRRLERWGLSAVLAIAGSAAPAVGSGLRDTTLAAVRAAAPTAARASAVWVKWAGAATFTVVLAAATGIGFAALRGPAEPPKREPAPAPPVATAAPAEKADAAGDPLPPGALARMGSNRFHHGSNIHRLTVSPDGKWVISYGSHTGYRVWELATGKERVPVGMPPESRSTGPRGMNRPVQWEALIAPAGKRVVAVVPDREKPITRILDVVTGEEVASVPASLRHVLTRPFASSDREPELSPDGTWLMWTHTAVENNVTKKTVYAADLTAKNPNPIVFAELTDRTLFGYALSADGNSVVMHFEDAYEVWDRAAGTAKLKVPVKKDGTWLGHAVISGDGKTLAVVQPTAATFQLWDVPSRKELPAVADPFAAGKLDVRCFSPDGRQVVASSSTGPLRVWDVATGKKVRDYDAGYQVWAAAVTPDGKRIAVAQFDDVTVLDRATGKSIHDFGGHTQSVWNVDFAANDRLVSFAGSGLVWNPRTGRKLGDFRGPRDGIHGVAVSPTGRLIATSGADQKVRLRDAVTLEEVRVIGTKGPARHDVEFAPDGKELAVFGDESGVRVLDTTADRPARVFAAGETASWLQLTPDGRRLVFGHWNDKLKVRVWDRTTDKAVLTFDAGKRSINRPALSADGRFLAAGDWDGHARVYDLGSGKLVREFDTNPPNVAAHETDVVYAVAFSPDGRTLATGGASGTVRVWELATGGERFRLGGHRGSVLSLAFSPDGTLLASGSGDRSIVAWDATRLSVPIEARYRPADAAEAWARLADRDAAVGHGAIRFLAARQAEAGPLFATHIRPVAAADPKAIADALGKLGSEDFAEREAAERALLAAGEGAADQLRAALKASESAEVRRRLARLLAPYGGVALTGDRLRTARAVEATERAGTADAKNLLREWAGGVRGAALTEAARSALARLGGER
jgi:RNA polymerase sigma factor (sigma-70 family)